MLALSVRLVRADTLDQVLQRMDQAAQKFRSLSANIHKTVYTDSITNTDVEDGSFKMMKSGKDKFVLLAEFTGQDAYKLRLAGTQAEMYYPKAKTVQVYDTRKVTKSVDQYLFVGFGTRTAELRKTYTVTLGGPETIGGVKTTRIDLTPNSGEATKLFNKIQLWIPDGDGSPIQEKIISGKTGKDYKLFQYSDRKIGTISDPPLPASDFDLNLPAGVMRRVMK
jgi:outer membrane lipoprotein-sorting protein